MTNSSRAGAPPTVSVVITNRNGMRYLDGCLQSLREQDYPNPEIIVVDNGSTDGSVDHIVSNYPEVRVLRVEKNLGFAAANNIGIKSSSGELIVLLNNDTRSHPGMISAFIASMQRDAVLGAAQAKIRLMRSPNLLDNGIGSFFTNSGFLRHVGHLEPDPGFTSPQPIFAAKGACLCLRGEAISQAGLFDETFFAYFEDSDLCWRIGLAGYQVAFVPNAEVLHVLGGSTNEVGYNLIHFHSFKNRIRSLVVNLGMPRLLYVLPFHLGLCLVLIGILTLSGRTRAASGILQAVIWNAQNLPDSLRRRHLVQTTVRRVSDAELLRDRTLPITPRYFLRALGVYAANFSGAAGCQPTSNAGPE